MKFEDESVKEPEIEEEEVEFESNEQPESKTKIILVAIFIVLVFLLAIFMLFSITTDRDVEEEGIAVVFPQESSVLERDIHTFQAAVYELSVEEYRMYWKVEDAVWNIMHNSDDRVAKEADASLEHWDWNNDGPYYITFIATDYEDNVLYVSDPVRIFIREE